MIIYDLKWARETHTVHQQLLLLLWLMNIIDLHKQPKIKVNFTAIARKNVLTFCPFIYTFAHHPARGRDTARQIDRQPCAMCATWLLGFGCSNKEIMANTFALIDTYTKGEPLVSRRSGLGRGLAAVQVSL